MRNWLTVTGIANIKIDAVWPTDQKSSDGIFSFIVLAPHRTAPHRTAPHGTARHGTARDRG
ncbi:MAG: hypothetical protein Q7U50_00510 [Candidatus Nitrotoga sp.]|nr:hypothetical protein [Candidatus Nitrotoga sp.]